MAWTCSKCGATNDGLIAGLNPCHFRQPQEDHNFTANTGNSNLLLPR
jgi:hypothetical protein